MRSVGADADHLGLLWLVILAIVMSAVSFYYYLQVLKQAYVLDAPENAPAINVPPVMMLTLVVLAALVILLGCAPGWLLRCSVKLAGTPDPAWTLKTGLSRLYDFLTTRSLGISTAQKNYLSAQSLHLSGK